MVNNSANWCKFNMGFHYLRIQTGISNPAQNLFWFLLTLVEGQSWEQAIINIKDSEIAKQYGITRSTCCRLMQELVKKGLLHKIIPDGGGYFYKISRDILTIGRTEAPIRTTRLTSITQSTQALPN